MITGNGFPITIYQPYLHSLTFSEFRWNTSNLSVVTLFFLMMSIQSMRRWCGYHIKQHRRNLASNYKKSKAIQCRNDLSPFFYILPSSLLFLTRVFIFIFCFTVTSNSSLSCPFSFISTMCLLSTCYESGAKLVIYIHHFI